MLKKLRLDKKMSQKEAAALLGISLRSYKTYENDDKKKETMRYKYYCEQLSKINPIDEEHGIRELEDIKSISSEVFAKYEVSFCYLFGSYAKDRATETSDIDLLICTDVTGLRFYGLLEELRERLQKKIDLLDVAQLKDNLELTKEVLKDGIKIYG